MWTGGHLKTMLQIDKLITAISNLKCGIYSLLFDLVLAKKRKRVIIGVIIGPYPQCQRTARSSALSLSLESPNIVKRQNARGLCGAGFVAARRRIGCVRFGACLTGSDRVRP
jgi:hypothetical protein